MNSIIAAVNVWVSSPPITVLTTETTLTDWHNIISPCHLPKILGKNAETPTKVTLYEPPKCPCDQLPYQAILQKKKDQVYSICQCWLILFGIKLSECQHDVYLQDVNTYQIWYHLIHEHQNWLRGMIFFFKLIKVAKIMPASFSSVSITGYAWPKMIVLCLFCSERNENF